jgi:predicted metalloprotease with PDZ domain
VDAVEPNGIAAIAGIRAGDLLVGVNRRQVTTVAELEQHAAGESGPRGLSIQVSRDGVITEAFVASSRAERERNAAEPVADRSCATFTLDAQRRVYREAGCSIAPRKICNGCVGR